MKRTLTKWNNTSVQFDAGNGALTTDHVDETLATLRELQNRE
jgi:hypothetical protein